jgi:hypothetical protein
MWACKMMTSPTWLVHERTHEWMSVGLFSPVTTWRGKSTWRASSMNGKSTEGQRDLMCVGQYQVTFNEAGADIVQMSTLARYCVQAATATNAVDFMKHHKHLIFAMLSNSPGDLDAYRIRPHAEGSQE